MSLDSFKVLVGLQLSILRRAADMLVLHFGGIRVHPSGKGTVGTYALHAQCTWRFNGPGGKITGRDDLPVLGSARRTGPMKTASACKIGSSASFSFATSARGRG
jgi:hypothetical protein